MMQLIQQALAVGWSADQILNYLSRKVKNLSGGINNSRNAGYTDEDILKFVQGKIKTPGKVDEPNTAYGRYLKESGLLTKEEKQQKRQKGMQAAMQAGGTALTALAAYRSMGQLGSAAQRMLGTGAPTPAQQTPGSPVQPTPGPAPMAGAPMQPHQVSGQQGSPQPTPGSAGSTGYDVIANSRLGPILANVKQQMNAQEARSFTKKMFGNEMIKDLERVSGKPFEQIFEEYQQFRSQEQNDDQPDVDGSIDAEAEMPAPIPEDEIIAQDDVQIEDAQFDEQEQSDEDEQKPIEKGSFAFTPDGKIGRVEDLPSKTAKLDSNGVKSVVETENLIESPLPEDELSDLWDNLIGGIEKKTGEQVSRNVSLAGWDPQSQALLYRPHGGASYVYTDLPTEQLDKLLSYMTRKTTGENLIGSWEEGTESPIGAAMSKIVIELIKTRGKGKEYSYKFDSIYDPLKPAYDAAKERYKKRKKREKKKR